MNLNPILSVLATILALHAPGSTETFTVEAASRQGRQVEIDAVFAAESAFGERIAHGPMSIGMAFGLLSRLDLFDGSVLALRNVEWGFDAPVRIGDTVHVEATVEEVSAHPRSKDRGRLTMTAKYVNQDGKTVSTGRFTVVIARRS